MFSYKTFQCLHHALLCLRVWILSSQTSKILSTTSRPLLTIRSTIPSSRHNISCFDHSLMSRSQLVLTDSATTSVQHWAGKIWAQIRNANSNDVCFKWYNFRMVKQLKVGLLPSTMFIHGRVGGMDIKIFKEQLCYSYVVLYGQWLLS